MHQLLQSAFIVLLFVLVRAGDLAITYGIGRSYGRMAAYSLVAILALIVVIITLLGLR